MLHLPLHDHDELGHVHVDDFHRYGPHARGNVDPHNLGDHAASPKLPLDELRLLKNL